MLNAATIFGRTLPNFAADKLGPFNGLILTLNHPRYPTDDIVTTVAIPMTIISGALIFAMFGASSTEGLLAFAVVYGIFAGGCKSSHRYSVQYNTHIFESLLTDYVHQFCPSLRRWSPCSRKVSMKLGE